MEENERREKEREALNSLQRWCSVSEHSCGEVRRKLEDSGLGTFSQERIVASLVRDGFVNEERFARAFVHDKLRFNKWGRCRIRYMLTMKMVEGQIIENAISEIDEDLYMSILEKVVRSSYKSQKADTTYERSRKTMRAVISRGFEAPLIKEVLQDILGEDPEDQE